MIPSVKSYIQGYGDRVAGEFALKALGINDETIDVMPTTTTIELAIDAMSIAHQSFEDLGFRLGGYPVDGSDNPHVSALAKDTVEAAMRYWNEHANSVKLEPPYLDLILQQYVKSYTCLWLEERVREEWRTGGIIRNRVIDMCRTEFDLCEAAADKLVADVADALPIKPVKLVATEDIRAAIQAVLKA